MHSARDCASQTPIEASSTAGAHLSLNFDPIYIYIYTAKIRG